MNNKYYFDSNEAIADCLFNVCKMPKLTTWTVPQTSLKDGVVGVITVSVKLTNGYRRRQNDHWANGVEFMEQNNVTLCDRRLAYTQRHHMEITVARDDQTIGQVRFSIYTKHHHSSDLLIGGALLPDYDEYDSAVEVDLPDGLPYMATLGEDHAKNALALALIFGDHAQTQAQEALAGLTKLLSKVKV